MKKRFNISLTILLMAGLALPGIQTVSSAAGFRVYPGAKLDERANREADEAARQMKIPSKSKIYTTNDSVEKVSAFYLKFAKEYIMPGGRSQKGIEARFFILDNGKDLSDSKSWVKVQRPALGLYKEDKKTMKTRDITVIVVVEN